MANVKIQASLMEADKKLHELCQARHMGRPIFTFEQYPNLPPHAPMFLAVCKVGDQATTGTGNSKKKAKKQASLYMLDIFENLHPEAVEKVSGKRKSSSDSPSDAISELYSKCARYRATVQCQFETMQSPKFVCNMSTEYGKAVGEGQSKKEAKRDATNKIIEKFDRPLIEGNKIDVIMGVMNNADRVVKIEM